MPDAARGSLRALSANLGTSHQLLSYYLRRLDRWQGREQAKEYQRRQDYIRARAGAEGRSLTSEEERQVRYYTGAIYRAILDPGLRALAAELRQKAMQGPLSKEELKQQKILARSGF